MIWKRVLLRKFLRRKPYSRKGNENSVTSSTRTDLIDCVSQAPGVKSKRKRDKFNPIHEKTGPIRRRSRKQIKTMDQKADSVDRISDLPDDIILNILSFLRSNRDVVRTSSLSRRWKQIWASFTVLQFDQREFQKQEIQFLDFRSNEEPFIDFIDRSLQTRSDLKLEVGIQKFRLRMTSYHLELATHIDRWIGFAVGRNIQELDVDIPQELKEYVLHRSNVIPLRSVPYTVPHIVFSAESITALKIYQCKLEIPSDMRLRNLKKLCLGELHVDEQIIQSLEESCPLIEDLRLIGCCGLKVLKITNLLKLSRVDLYLPMKIMRSPVHNCPGLEKVELKAPNLRKFWYQGKKSRPCKFNFAACETLESLTLEEANMTDDFFQDLLSWFPVLEELVLRRCTALTYITVSSYRLKKVALRECKNLKVAVIDTPNLFSFEYKGVGIPFSSLNPSGLMEATLSFVSKRKYKTDQGFFASLWEFLGNFDCTKGLKLVVRSNKNIIIQEDLREFLIPQLHDLELEIIKSSTKFDDLLDSLLRTWHPETLCIVHSSSSKLPEMVYEKLINREENPSCCRYVSSSNKCWLHFLKDVEVVDFEEADHSRSAFWTAWLELTPPVLNATTSYSLSWKPYESE